MARVNVGLNPIYLADQHLIAESVEITMITGQLQQHNFVIKSEIPKIFPLGKGHMTFFKDKLSYLERRLVEVNREMHSRGFAASTNLTEVLIKAPDELINTWTPTMEDSVKLRTRIVSRLIERRTGKPGQGYYRYRRQTIPNILEFCKDLNESELFWV